MKNDWIFVDTPKKIDRAIDNLENAAILSIDTEYDSFRYFREILCLIQIHANETTYIFDPLGELNFAFLGKLFNDKKIVKILHAADNDIRLLKRDYQFDFHNVFDTHRAALILGLHQLSLEKMINHFLNADLKKSKKMQRSRWDKRPLTDEQLLYAMQDVTFLPALYEEQLKQLREKGLEETATDAFVKISAATWQERIIDRRGYAKIAGYYSLNSEQKELLKKLYAWRFQRAKEENRAIFMFLPDNNLLELAQNHGNINDILPAEKFKLYGEQLELIISENK
ncbi:MAG: ribonuclease D [Deltaproteobacteria bacterium]